MNAGIVLGVSQNPECTGLSHPADLIQGHSGPEFETLGVWLKQLQLIGDDGSSLKCVSFGNLAQGWMCRNQSSVSHCPWFWEHLIFIWCAAVPPVQRVVFLYFFPCSFHCHLDCVSGQRGQVGPSELQSCVRWTFQVSHCLLADLWPPWQTLGCVVKMSLPLKTIQRWCCLVKKEEKGTVWLYECVAVWLNEDSK